MRKLVFLVAVVLAAVPAAFASTPSSNHSSAQAVTAAYATFGACVSKLAPVDQGNLSSANAACQAQQADANFAASHDGKTFDQFYGHGPQGKGAFGACVSASVKASEATESQSTPNPARTCRAARTAMGVDAFKALYGTNANKSNAFGKCVSKTAQAQTTNEVNAAKQCRTDASVTSSTAAPNAFGACVSAKTKAASSKQEHALVKAAKACHTELVSIGAAAFANKYGTFGHCVSQHAKA